MKELSDYGVMVQYPQKGDPIIDIAALRKYCQTNNVDTNDGYPTEIVERFIIGYRK